MKTLLFNLLSICILFSCNTPTTNKTSTKDDILTEKKIVLSKKTLQDKIKGGWAGQTIGVTYGGTSEFQYCGSYIKDYTPITWEKGYIKTWFDHGSGLYDDLYMDLTFVSVFEKYGLDAPVDSFAMAFARADYPLWHANQNGRYNILHKIMPPQSGHWKNNPHADDIDFQIEADFAGLMAPAMINSSSDICDKIGHITNYGDGWYGGVYVAAMYSLAFYSNDIQYIVKQSLNIIPKESTYYQCINDVINWHTEFPNDWHKTWEKLEDKWGNETGCPDGVFRPFSIDAKMNSAYIVIGLLYGNGNFEKTMDISTRCGQDADCNPSSAAGILGTMLGYSNIPEQWKADLHEVEDINFIYTDISLNKLYEIGFNHACKVIEKNQGKILADSVEILVQTPKAVKLEKSFEGLLPTNRIQLIHRQGLLYDNKEYAFEFTGNALVVKGEAFCDNWKLPRTETIYAELYIDGKLMETADLPLDFKIRKHELFWNYELPDGKHKGLIKLKNPKKEYGIKISEIIIYSTKK